VEAASRSRRVIVTRTRSGVLPSGLPLPQIASCNLDVAVIGQLPPPKFALSDQSEPGPVEVVSFETASGCGCLRKESLEHTSGNPGLLLHIHIRRRQCELDHGALGFHRASGGKRKNMTSSEGSGIVLPKITQMRRGVECSLCGSGPPSQSAMP
jgi:hypothetical protein